MWPKSHFERLLHCADSKVKCNFYRLNWTLELKHPPLCEQYWKLLKQFKMKASMSRKGNCYDNAPIESFWGTLKNELVYHRSYETREQAIQDITEYIEIFYNRREYRKG